VAATVKALVTTVRTWLFDAADGAAVPAAALHDRGKFYDYLAKHLIRPCRVLFNINRLHVNWAAEINMARHSVKGDLDTFFTAMNPSAAQGDEGCDDELDYDEPDYYDDGDTAESPDTNFDRSATGGFTFYGKDFYPRLYRLCPVFKVRRRAVRIDGRVLGRGNELATMNATFDRRVRRAPWHVGRSIVSDGYSFSSIYNCEVNAFPSHGAPAAPAKKKTGAAAAPKRPPLAQPARRHWEARRAPGPPDAYTPYMRVVSCDPYVAQRRAPRLHLPTT
jgi:hypothetical protein